MNPTEKFKPCSVEACTRNAHRSASGYKGFCQNHYRRLRLYGDPLGGKTPPGDAIRFVQEVAIPAETTECLEWPFAKYKSGYPQVTVGGRTALTHRYICETVRGAPPTPEHHAAHSCGNRACVNPRHLSWKTPTENQADKLLHGTHMRGERHNLAKLTEPQVREVLALRGRATQKEIATSFGITKSAVAHIHQGRSWAWVSTAIDAENKRARP